MSTHRLAAGAAAVALLLTVYAAFYAATTPARQIAPGMGGQMGQMSQNPTPPVKGLYKGKELLFIHTEASAPQVAEMLTKMMGPKVFTVASLAKVPTHLLADVYVFTNGVKGEGPFGFQVDVFDAVPGQARYTPLRALNLVTWRKGRTPRVLGSVEEIQAAARKGDVALRRPGVVVNMPIITWPGGHR
ncbi:MAG: hypothetical protein HY660_07505 [Armatimonadetes bacterium]|nr:hypothetical protein [Armatimonadota bacterium]